MGVGYCQALNPIPVDNQQTDFLESFVGASISIPCSFNQRADCRRLAALPVRRFAREKVLKASFRITHLITLFLKGADPYLISEACGLVNSGTNGPA